ncbi:urate hydroxylase PuuD [Hyalangium sp.]|uniref:urate hydroxylase PuuD n=1 Tax=Hyalangium sp. TaxID=2028555 RepID=UPI002D225C2F|nr:urate hydroxylase PuuD [Hyalangium sp.]HYH96241.1 urate hydroxylase PuuD [Hyalangium sp.]
MSPVVQEWLNLVVRWAHVIAAIMWIGDSFLFMWLDSQLRKPEQPREGDVVGELWMAHSGGFYEVVKRKSLQSLPPQLHWFKWESYSTWISGFLLLIIVYYLGDRAMLTDTSSPLSHPQAVGISLGLIVASVVVYDLLCRTPLIRDNRAFGAVGFVLITAASYGILQVFSPRATFLQVGAMLGTLMASNVFFRIIPAQKHMLAATREGRPVDTSYGARAKQRSTHNHYLTLPVLFTMVSNHFPVLYGHSEPWAVLALLFIAGTGMKYIMNFRARTHPVVFTGTAVALLGVAVMTAPQAAEIDPALAAGPKVSFATAQAIVQTRCVTCHAEKPTNPSFTAPPLGVMLDTPERLQAHAQRVFVRTVQTETMPLGNMTSMNEPERKLLGAWIAQGADTKAPGPADVPTVAARTKVYASPAEEARAVFTQRCVPCHGPEGRGNGPSAAALNPKPRNYSDPEWQKTVTDESITQTILGGGMAVGKSEIMPANPDLEQKPEVLSELVKLLRSFGTEGSP